MAVLEHAGVPAAEAAPPLATFSGAARRFQETGRQDGVLVVDDYAHHPSELAATLRAAKLGDHRRVIAVFQPHLFSRTRYLQREFGRALTLADEAVVTDVFAAREEPEPGITGKLIVDAYLTERPGGPVGLHAAPHGRGAPPERPRACRRPRAHPRRRRRVPGRGGAAGGAALSRRRRVSALTGEKRARSLARAAMTSRRRPLHSAGTGRAVLLAAAEVRALDAT